MLKLSEMHARIESMKNCIQSLDKEIELARFELASCEDYTNDGDEGFSSDSDGDFPYTFNSEVPLSEMQNKVDTLRTCLQATQELAGLEVLESEVNLLVDPPKVKRLPRVDGTWHQVDVSCMADIVPFKMSFITFRPSRQFAPPSFYNMSVSVQKAVFDLELSKSVLPTLRMPSDVVELLRNYGEASRSRRTTLAALVKKYDHVLCMERNKADGGFILKCADLLELQWRLKDKRSHIAPFQHHMSANLEYMDKSYINIVRKAYKALSQPDLTTEERTTKLGTIIDTCIRAQKPTQDLYDSMSSDPEVVKSLRKRRTTLDQNHEDDVSEESDELDEHVTEKEIMAPPKSLPKKAKPKDKENINSNVISSTGIVKAVNNKRANSTAISNDENQIKKFKGNSKEPSKTPQSTELNEDASHTNTRISNMKLVKRPTSNNTASVPAKIAKPTKKSINEAVKDVSQKSGISKNATDAQKENDKEQEKHKATKVIKNVGKPKASENQNSKGTAKKQNNNTDPSKAALNNKVQSSLKNNKANTTAHGNRISSTSENSNKLMADSIQRPLINDMTNKAQSKKVNSRNNNADEAAADSNKNAQNPRTSIAKNKVHNIKSSDNKNTNGDEVLAINRNVQNPSNTNIKNKIQNIKSTDNNDVAMNNEVINKNLPKQIKNKNGENKTQGNSKKVFNKNTQNSNENKNDKIDVQNDKSRKKNTKTINEVDQHQGKNPGNDVQSIKSSKKNIDYPKRINIVAEQPVEQKNSNNKPLTDKSSKKTSDKNVQNPLKNLKDNKDHIQSDKTSKKNTNEPKTISGTKPQKTVINKNSENELHNDKSSKKNTEISKKIINKNTQKSLKTNFNDNCNVEPEKNNKTVQNLPKNVLNKPSNTELKKPSGIPRIVSASKISRQPTFIKSTSDKKDAPVILKRRSLTNLKNNQKIV